MATTAKVEVDLSTVKRVIDRIDGLRQLLVDSALSAIAHGRESSPTDKLLELEHCARLFYEQSEC